MFNSFSISTRLIFFLIGYTAFTNGVYQLKPISTIYIPSSYDSDGTPKYKIDGGAVEQSAYDPTDKIIYGAGSRYLHVVDISTPSFPVIIKSIRTSGVANDIELCDGNIAIAIANDDPSKPGSVEIFGLFSKTLGSLPLVQTVTVGRQPDMLKFTKDCRTIAVANEGEAFTSNDKEDIINPEGSVSIIKFVSKDLSTTPNILTADFQRFNLRSDEYESKFVRYPYKGQISKQKDTFSQNLEPEYIAFSSDESKAYVVLQENNAIAIVDLETGFVDEIVGMGVKSWENLGLDASNKDSGINLQSWPIYSFYQPDSMIHYEINGMQYLATANEGDSFEYETKDDKWKEAERGETLIKDSLVSDRISHNLWKYLDNDEKLGRLQFSTVDGLNNKGKIEKLYHFGGRSWSIFKIDGNNLTMTYDSGDDAERMMALYYPDVFNGNTKPDDPDDETPEDLFDSRSDNKGPECESLTYGEVEGNRLIFMGSDRSSSIMIYELDLQGNPTFQSIYRSGKTDKTFENLLEKQNLGDLDPEDLRFISGIDSPTGNASLLVTSTVSGTISLYEIHDIAAPMPANQDQSSRSHRLQSPIVILIVILALLEISVQ